MLGDPVIAAAILDRLMHNAIVFNIRGPSWRLREHDSLQIAATQPSARQPHPAKPAPTIPPRPSLRIDRDIPRVLTGQA